jgi:hypothetical protein
MSPAEKCFHIPALSSFIEWVSLTPLNNRPVKLHLFQQSLIAEALNFFRNIYEN